VDAIFKIGAIARSSICKAYLVYILARPFSPQDAPHEFSTIQKFLPELSSFPQPIIFIAYPDLKDDTPSIISYIPDLYTRKSL
jgi:hypothetical protein